MNSLVFWVCAAALVFVLLVGYRGFIGLIVSLLRLASYAQTLENSPHRRKLDAESAPPLSLVLPQCDADGGIVQTVEGLLHLDYPAYEIIAVCDAGRGAALPKLTEAFGLVPVSQPVKMSVPMQPVQAVYRSPENPGLVVVAKEVGGRSDALNTGVNISRYPLIVTLSAGRRMGAEGLARMAQPFALSYRVAAVGGLPRVEEDRKGALAALQRAEYLHTFPAGLAVPGQNSLPLLPDAFGAFRKQTLIGEGGFAKGAGETEMVLRLYRKRVDGKRQYEIQLLAEPVFEAEPAKGLTGLFRQRRRWQKEMVSSLRNNRAMLLNARYGRTGLWDVPCHWLFDVIAPVMELLGCLLTPAAYAFALIGPALFWGFWAAEVLLGVVVSLAAVATQQIIDSDAPSLPRLLRLICAAALGSVGYRQLVVLFRVAAMLTPAPGRDAD